MALTVDRIEAGSESPRVCQCGRGLARWVAVPDRSTLLQWRAVAERGPLADVAVAERARRATLVDVGECWRCERSHRWRRALDEAGDGIRDEFAAAVDAAADVRDAVGVAAGTVRRALVDELADVRARIERHGIGAAIRLEGGTLVGDAVDAAGTVRRALVDRLVDVRARHGIGGSRREDAAADGRDAVDDTAGTVRRTLGGSARWRVRGWIADRFRRSDPWSSPVVVGRFEDGSPLVVDGLIPTAGRWIADDPRHPDDRIAVHRITSRPVVPWPDFGSAVAGFDFDGLGRQLARTLAEVGRPSFGFQPVDDAAPSDAVRKALDALWRAHGRADADRYRSSSLGLFQPWRDHIPPGRIPDSWRFTRRERDGAPTGQWIRDESRRMDGVRDADEPPAEEGPEPVR